jgi:hypothetical protein
VKPGTGLRGAYALGATLGMSAKRGHSRHGDSEVLRARRGREEANIHIEGRYIYR